VRYESCVADNHHHLVCRACGVAVDVDCAVGEAACLEPSDRSGFTIDEAEQQRLDKPGRQRPARRRGPRHDPLRAHEHGGDRRRAATAT
jgi:hypothetical protein